MRKLSLVTAAAVMTATLTACPGKDVPPAGDALQNISATAYEVETTGSNPATFQTRAVTWKSGAQNLYAFVEGQTTPLSTSQIAADGKLTLTLPETLPDSVLKVQGGLEKGRWENMPQTTCTGGITASDKALRGAAVIFGYGTSSAPEAMKLIFPGEAPTVQYVQENNIPHLKGKVVLGSYIYADRPSNITGTQSCKGSFIGYGETNTTYTVNVQLKKGWNYVSMIETNDNSEAGETMTLTLASAVPSTNWYTQGGLGGVAVPLSLQGLQGQTLLQ